MADFVGAVDQGTTSTRFMIFDHGGNEVARHQLEHEQILPQAGWVEHNPVEIWERTRAVIQTALQQGQPAAPPTWPRSASPTSARPRWCGTATPAGPTTTRSSGRTPAPTGSPPRWSATGRGDVIRHKAGLPPATYFSGGKIQWILENVDGVREAAERGDAVFGNTDTWLLWNLTGGADGGVHVTDVTNASRTMLMNLETLDWDDELLGVLRHPAGDAAGDPAVARTRSRYGVDARERPARRRGAAHRRPRRPAGGHRRPGLLRPRRGQEHLRHRQLHAAQHRHRAGPLEGRPAHHGLLPVRRRARRSTRWRARSR